MMSKKSPQLRFEGFTDDWEVRKLGDVVGEIQSGNRLPKDSLTSGNIPYVVAQTKNEGVFKTISKKTLDYNGNPMKLFPGNSISFSIDNPEAMFYRSTEFYTSNIMRVIHADYLSHQQYLFILENMKSFTRGYDWSRKFSGPVVSNLEYLQPNEQEQCKIGSFILAFDNIITLHQRKLDLLKEQKKGYLQKMFPKNGEKIPELRFAGFADDWELRKVGELLTERNEQAPMNDEFPLMAFIANEGVAPKGERYDRSSLVNDTAGKLYKKTRFGDFIYSSNNLETGSIGLNKYGNASVSPVYSIFEATGIADSDFIGRRLVRKDFINAMIKWRQGVVYGQWKIHESDFVKIEVAVPSVDEQRQIGEFLDTLDQHITLHQRKLDLLKEQKKGYLQKMFV